MSQDIEETFKRIARSLEYDTSNNKSSNERLISSLKELREKGFDLSQSSGLASYLEIFLPKFIQILQDTPIRNMKCEEHDIRNSVLDLIGKLPATATNPGGESLRQQLPHLINSLMQVLLKDNEENAALCIQTLLEFQKIFKLHDTETIRTFLDFVKQIYEGLPNTIALLLGSGGGNESFIPSSTQSFKVITECPLFVSLLYQLFRDVVFDSLKSLIPKLVQAIQSSGHDYNSLSPLQRTRFVQMIGCQVKTLSFITSLIRTPALGEVVRMQEQELAANIVKLLKMCPPECISDRKDLLSATRHIIATDLRSGFFPHIGAFLEEGLLLGGINWMPTSSSSSSTGDRLGAHPLIPERELMLQPLACSLLADLIHHVRGNLKLSQMSKVIYIFSRNLHDSRLPLNIQITSVRLLLNLVESIFQNEEPEPNAARQLIVHILYTLVSKFGTLRYYIPDVVNADIQSREKNTQIAQSGTEMKAVSYYFTNPAKVPGSTKHATPNNNTSNDTSSANGDSMTLISADGEEGYSKLSDSSNNIDLLYDSDSMCNSLKVLEQDNVKDLRSLVTTMLMGLKTVLWCVCNYGPKKFERTNAASKHSGQQLPMGISGLLSQDEMKIISKLFKWGFQCLPIFRGGLDLRIQMDSGSAPEPSRTASKPDDQTNTSSSKLRIESEETEKIEQFAEIFTVLDSHNFADLLRSRMMLLYANIVRYPAALAFAKRLLRNKNVAHVYFHVQLEFLVERLEELAGDFKLLDNEMVTGHDFSNILCRKPEQLSFENIPDGSQYAATSLSGLGVSNRDARMNVFVDIVGERVTIERCKRRLENSHKDSDCRTDISFGDACLENCITDSSNATSVLSQLLEHLVLHIELYTDESKVGPPPSTINFSSPKIPPSATSQKTSASVSPGWSIALSVQAQLEKLVVLCFVLAAQQTSSSHCYLRGSISNKQANRFRTQYPEARHLVNAAYRSRNLTSLQSALGRDCFLLALRGILRIVARRAVLQEILRSKINSLIVPSIRALSQLLLCTKETDDRIGKESRKDLIAEITLLFSVRISRNEIHKHLPILQNALEIAFKSIEHRNIDLCRLALRILESWVDNLDTGELDALFVENTIASGQGNSSFALALSGLLKPSPNPCGTTALRVLGKLSHRARASVMFYAQRRSNQPRLDDSALVFELAWAGLQQSNQRAFKADAILRSAAQYLRTTYAPNVTQDFPEAYFSVSESAKRQRYNGSPQQYFHKATRFSDPHKASDDEQRLSYYKHRVVELHLACLSHFFQFSQSQTFGIDGDEVELHLDDAFPGDNSDMSSPETDDVNSKKQIKRSALRRILDTLLLACCDIHCGHFAWSMVEGIVVSIFLSSSGDRAKSNHLETIIPGQGIDATVLCEVLADALGSSNVILARLGLHVLGTLCKLSRELGVVDTRYPFFQYLLEIFSDQIHERQWNRRLAGLLGARFLMSALSQEWIEKNAPVIVDMFAFVLATHEDQWGIDVLYHATCGVQELILQVLHQDCSSSLTSRDRCWKAFAEILAKPLLSQNRMTRDIIKSVLSLCAYCLEQPVGDLLKSSEVFLGTIKSFLHTSYASKGRQTQTTLIVLDTLIFSLNNGFYSELLDFGNQDESSPDSLLFILSDAIVKAEAAEKIDTGGMSYLAYLDASELTDRTKLAFANSVKYPGCLYGGMYPYLDIPNEIRLRSLVTDLVRCLLATNDSIVFEYLCSENCRKTRDRAITFAFLSSICQWPSIASSGIQASKEISRLAGTQLKEGEFIVDDAVVTECRRIISHSISSLGAAPSTLTKSLLQGLTAFITQYPDDPMIQNDELPKALLHILRSILSPSSIVTDEPLSPEPQRNVYPKLQYLDLAAQILETFNAFSDQIVQNYLEKILFEAVRLEAIIERLTHARVTRLVAERSGTPLSHSIISMHHFLVHGHLSSPIKEVLVKILARWPLETMKYFFRPEKLRSTELFRLLKAILVHNVAKPLRSCLISEPITSLLTSSMLDLSNFAQLADSKAQREQVLMSFQAISLVNSVTSIESQWLLDSPNLLFRVLEVWRNASIFGYITIESQLPWSSRQYYAQTCRIVTSYVRSVQDSIGQESMSVDEEVRARRLRNAVVVVYDLLRIVVMRTSMDNAFLHRFFKFDVVLNSTLEFKLAMVRHYVALTKKPGELSPHIHEVALRLIIVPLVTWGWNDSTFKNSIVFEGSSNTLGSDLVVEIVRCVHSSDESNSSEGEEDPVTNYISTFSCDVADSFVYPESVFGSTQSCRESLQVQLLHLATLLISNYGEGLKSHKKDLIKFAWNHLKSKSAECKQWAYVNICRFIHVYDTPEDIVLQVYVALLKEHSGGSRQLIQYALDVLIPALATRLSSENFFRAVRWARKLLIDDGQKLAQTVHIWQLVQKHPGVFYQNRAYFVSAMVQSLSRLWSSPGNENKKLSVDLAELFFRWEITRDREIEYYQKTYGESAFNAVSMTTRDLAAATSANGFRANALMISNVVHFLMRVSMVTAEGGSNDNIALHNRSLSLFKTSILYFEKILSGNSSSSKSPFKFSYISKQIETVIRRQNQKRAEAEKEASRKLSESQRTHSSSQKQQSTAPDSDKVSLDIAEIPSGQICCALEITRMIVLAEKVSIAVPFLSENSEYLSDIINPVFSCSEKGAHPIFLKLVNHLLSLYPLKLRAPATILFDHSGDRRSFFRVLIDEIKKRLELVADDGKNAIQMALANHAQFSASNTKGGTQSKAAQQKAAKIAVQRHARKIGAGPLGTYRTLLLVQLMCCRGHATLQEDGTVSPPSQGYDFEIVDVFMGSLFKIMTKLAKEVAAAAMTRAKEASKQSNAIGASPTILSTTTSKADEGIDLSSKSLILCISLLEERVLSHDVYRRNFLSTVHLLIDKLDTYDSHVILKILEAASIWVSAPMPSGSSAGDGGVSISGAASVGSLSGKERQVLITRLEQLERFDGIPGGAPIMKAYNDVVMKVLTCSGMAELRKKSSWVVQQLNGPLLCGLLSENIHQRHEFFDYFMSCNFKGKSVYSKLQLIMQQDWSHAGPRTWLSTATKILTSTVSRGSLLDSCTLEKRDLLQLNPGSIPLPEVVSRTFQELLKFRTVDALLLPIEEVVFGDRGDTLLNVWLEIFPCAWHSLQEQEKMIMTEGLEALLSRNYHLPKSVMYFTNLQKSAVNINRKSEKVSEAMTARKMELLYAGIASDPFQENSMLFTLRRVKTWDSLEDINAYNPMMCVLRALTLLDPLPIIAPELLKYAGDLYGASDETIEIAELMTRRYFSHQQNLPSSSIQAAAMKRSKRKRTGADSAAAAAAASMTKSTCDKKNGCRWMEMLRSLYNDSGNSDLASGLTRRWSAGQVSYAALAFEACDRWRDAQDAYMIGIKRTEAAKGDFIIAKRTDKENIQNCPEVIDPGAMMEDIDIGDFGDFGDFLDDLGTENLDFNTSNIGFKDSESKEDIVWLKKKLGATEIKSWLANWSKCCWEIGSWDQLGYLAGALNETGDLIESVFRTGGSGWASSVRPMIAQEQQQAQEVQQACGQDRMYLPSNIFSCMLPSRIALLSINLGLQESRAQADLDFFWRRAANLTLLEWATSNLTHGYSSGKHRALLYRFQRLAELEEASQYVSHIVQMTASNRGTGVGHNNRNLINRILLRWRQRRPTSTESLADWDDILASRQHVFSLAYSNHDKNSAKDASGNPIENMSSFFDAKWTLVERAKLYRNHALYLESLSILSQHTIQGTMDVEFKRLCERWTNLLLAKQSPVLSGANVEVISAGLSEILATNISRFSSENKAEFFRIRAMYQHALGDPREAIHALYSKAVQYDQRNADVWLEWALFTDELCQNTEILEDTAGIDVDLSVVIAGGILQAVMHGNTQARLHIPKVLWRLHLESEFAPTASADNVGKVSATITRHIVLLPCWIWLPWIPQLLALLSHGETSSTIASTLLILVAQEYPNALYYALRDKYVDCDSHRINDKKDINGSPGRPVKDAFARFHSMHPHLVQEIEMMLQELVNGCKSQNVFEELCVALDRLIYDCVALSEEVVLESSKVGSLTRQILTEMGRIQTQDFKAEAKRSGIDALLQDGFLPEILSFMDRIKRSTGSPELRTTLCDVVTGIMRWRSKISNTLSLHRSVQIPTYKWSVPLAGLRFQEVHIPGMHALCDGFTQPSLACHPQLYGISESVQVYTDGNRMHSRLGFVAGNGREVHFSLRKTPSVFATGSNVRSLQLRTLMNSLFENSYTVRKRQHLKYSLPVIVPVAPELILQYDEPDFQSLDEVFTQSFISMGRENPYGTVMLHVLESDDSSRYDIYRDICERVVPEDILTRHVRNLSRTASEFQLYREVNSKQCALSSLLNMLFSSSDRNLSSIVIDSSGFWYDLDLSPRYSGATNMLESIDSESQMRVPFRLTRNLEHFYALSGIDGIVVNSLIALVSCLTTASNRRILESYFRLYFLMDLVAVNSKDSRKNDALYQDLKIHNDTAVNTKHVLTLLENLFKESDDHPHTLEEADSNDIKNQIYVSYNADLVTEDPHAGDHGILEVIEQSRNPENIANMPFSWTPWF